MMGKQEETRQQEVKQCGLGKFSVVLNWIWVVETLLNLHLRQGKPKDWSLMVNKLHIFDWLIAVSLPSIGLTQIQNFCKETANVFIMVILHGLCILQVHIHAASKMSTALLRPKRQSV